MSRNDTEMTDAQDLDRRWDAVNAADPSMRRMDRADHELRELAELDPSEPPRLEFVAGLWSELRDEARRIGPVDRPATDLPVRSLEPVRPVARVRRMRGMSGANKVASLLLAASLLVGMVAALLRYPFTNQGGTGGPTVVAPGPAIPDVPMPGANPARTNIQPGPGLNMLPEIKQKADVAGLSMALADNMLVVVGVRKITALDANTLTVIWSVEPQAGVYSPPTIADGAVYLGYTRNTEAISDDPDNNQLVALALSDGGELWRVNAAGMYPVNPLVIDGTIYSVGATETASLLGAYRTTDGSTIWQKPIWNKPDCCPQMNLALVDGVLAVKLPNRDSISTYRAEDGTRLWPATAKQGHFIGEPTIVGGLVIVNSSSIDYFVPVAYSPGDVNEGATSAYDLVSGELKWANESTRTSRVRVSSVPDSNAILYAGAWVGSDGGQLALLSLENGQPLWKVAMPQVPGDKNTYSPSAVAPVIVGDTAYVTGSTVPTEGGSMQASLLSAVDLRTGDAQWMAQIDGGVVEGPIVSGGRIYILTHDAGLYVLGDSINPVGTPRTVVDLRSPVTCTAQPSNSPMLSDLPAKPTTPELAPWNEQVRFSEVPSGLVSNVSEPIARRIEQVYREYRACSAVDPEHSVFSFFSTDFYVRLKSVQAYWGTPEQPWAVWMAPMSEFLVLDVNSLIWLPDGRVGGWIISPVTNIYVWFVYGDGQWKIDEYHRVIADTAMPAAGTPVPSTNPEGTPLG
jgi:outer membrane protein assembly factor BamB